MKINNKLTTFTKDKFLSFFAPKISGDKGHNKKIIPTKKFNFVNALNYPLNDNGNKILQDINSLNGFIHRFNDFESSYTDDLNVELLKEALDENTAENMSRIRNIRSMMNVVKNTLDEIKQVQRVNASNKKG